MGALYTMHGHCCSDIGLGRTQGHYWRPSPRSLSRHGEVRVPGNRPESSRATNVQLRPGCGTYRIEPSQSLTQIHQLALSQPIVSLLMFYDAPTPPAGIFDDYLAIPALEQDVSTRSFLALVQSSAENITAGTRWGLFRPAEFQV